MNTTNEAVAHPIPKTVESAGDDEQSRVRPGGGQRVRHASGAAGEHAVMAELLIRGYNVSRPVVDVEEDVLVLRQDDEAIDRIQVKTARPHTRAESKTYVEYLTTLHAPRLTEASSWPGPEPYFIFVLVNKGFPKRWLYVIMTKGRLSALVEEHQLDGAHSKKRDDFTLTFHVDKSTDSVSFVRRGNSYCVDKYKDDWSRWPPKPEYA